MTPPALLSKSEVCDLVGMSFPTIWQLMRRNRFPAPVEIGGASVRWRADEVAAWIDGLPRRAYRPLA